MKKLYRVYREGYIGYDNYDSAVVVSSSIDEARDIVPSDEEEFTSIDEWDIPEHIFVEYLGIYEGELDYGDTVVASYNAG